MTRADATAAVEALVKWGKPREVPTKFGPRLLRKANPDEAFWNAWRAGKEQLRALGVAVSKNPQSQEWELCWWQEVPPEIKAARDAAVSESRATDAEIDIPCPPGLEYRPFQKAGVRFAMQRSGTLIGDEMGLGKTIQFIGVVNMHPEAQSVLVITKASLKMNWWRELRKWLVSPDLRNSIGIADGGCFPSTKVVVINFDIARKFSKVLGERHWDIVGVDECHLLKNPKAERTKAICGYKPKRDEPVELASSGIPARIKIGMTGTPIENRLEELWTVLWWLNREAFPSVSRLMTLAGRKYQQGVGYGAPTTTGLMALQNYLREHAMIRRLKKDVLKELPPKTRTVTEFTSEGLEHLVAREREIWEQTEEERIEAQADIEVAKASDDPEAYRNAVERLRRCNSIGFTELARVRAETAVAKIPQMIEHLRSRIDELGTTKILVFAHHTEVLERLHREFPRSVMIHGQHDLRERDERVHRFQTDEDCGPFFGSIRATGEGLTLTAASHVVFHECDWVPSKMAQCEDRAHRIGQRDNVTCEVCVVPGTIDAKMVKTCVEKADLADAALDNQVAAQIREEPVVAFDGWKPLATKRQLESEAILITPEQREAIGSALTQLDVMCDGARKIDGCGFNKIDSGIGKRLARLGHAMTDRQAALGARLVNKYRRQLDLGLVERAVGKKLETEKEAA